MYALSSSSAVCFRPTSRFTMSDEKKPPAMVRLPRGITKFPNMSISYDERGKKRFVVKENDVEESQAYDGTPMVYDVDEEMIAITSTLGGGQKLVTLLDRVSRKVVLRIPVGGEESPVVSTAKRSSMRLGHVYGNCWIGKQKLSVDVAVDCGGWVGTTVCLAIVISSAWGIFKDVVGFFTKKKKE